MKMKSQEEILDKILVIWYYDKDSHVIKKKERRD